MVFKKKFHYIVTATLCMFLVGCGKSSNNNSTPNTIQTEAQAFQSFCLDYPNHQACATENNEADELGFDSYMTNTGSVRDDYYNDGGLCGCGRSRQPVQYGRNGTMRCVETRRVEQRRSVLTVLVNFGGRRPGGFVGYDYERYSGRESNSYEGHGSSDGCYDRAVMGCNPRRQRVCFDESGYAIPGSYCSSAGFCEFD